MRIPSTLGAPANESPCAPCAPCAACEPPGINGTAIAVSIAATLAASFIIYQMGWNRAKS